MANVNENIISPKIKALIEALGAPQELSAEASLREDDYKRMNANLFGVQELLEKFGEDNTLAGYEFADFKKGATAKVGLFVITPSGKMAIMKDYGEETIDKATEKGTIPIRANFSVAISEKILSDLGKPHTPHVSLALDNSKQNVLLISEFHDNYQDVDKRIGTENTPPESKAEKITNHIKENPQLYTTISKNLLFNNSDCLNGGNMGMKNGNQAAMIDLGEAFKNDSALSTIRDACLASYCNPNELFLNPAFKESLADTIKDANSKKFKESIKTSVKEVEQSLKDMSPADKQEAFTQLKEHWGLSKVPKNFEELGKGLEKRIKHNVKDLKKLHQTLEKIERDPQSHGEVDWVVRDLNNKENVSIQKVAINTLSHDWNRNLTLLDNKSQAAEAETKQPSPRKSRLQTDVTKLSSKEVKEAITLQPESPRHALTWVPAKTSPRRPEIPSPERPPKAGGWVAVQKPNSLAKLNSEARTELNAIKNAIEEVNKKPHNTGDTTHKAPKTKGAEGRER